MVPLTSAGLDCPSIDHQRHLDDSARHVEDQLRDGRGAAAAALRPGACDAVLVACFSVHPLVARLPGLVGGAAVTGLLEAAVEAAAALTPPGARWGIVTTGVFWERQLDEGVARLLPGRAGAFAGTCSTGLAAAELHAAPAERVRAALAEATRRLLRRGDVRCVVLGCGGMAGLDDAVRDAAHHAGGPAAADGLFVVDGVKAGIVYLHKLLADRAMFGRAAMGA